MKNIIFFIALLVVTPTTLAKNAFVQVTQVEMTQELEDKRLAGKIRSTIAFERRLADTRVKVKVSSRNVIFYGRVNNTKEQQLLIEIVKLTVGESAPIQMQKLLVASADNSRT